MTATNIDHQPEGGKVQIRRCVLLFARKRRRPLLRWNTDGTMHLEDLLITDKSLATWRGFTAYKLWVSYRHARRWWLLALGAWKRWRASR